MIRKLFVTAALAASFVAPAYAATTYYVAQDAKSHKCSVTTKKPDGKLMMEIGTAGFNTKAAATTAMKADTACSA
jgi:hydroxymethylglutaryl-CoA reductase